MGKNTVTGKQIQLWILQGIRKLILCGKRGRPLKIGACGECRVFPQLFWRITQGFHLQVQQIVKTKCHHKALKGAEQSCSVHFHLFFLLTEFSLCGLLCPYNEYERINQPT